MTDVAAPAAAPATPASAPVAAEAPSTTAAPATAPASATDAASVDPLDIEYELKIDGETRKKSLRQMIADQQRAESANKRFQEAARLREEAAARESQLDQAERALEMALREPGRFARLAAQMGIDPRQFAAQLQGVVEAEAALTPEQRRLRELEERETMREAEAATQRKQMVEHQASQLQARMSAQFNKAFEMANVPPSGPLRATLTAHFVDVVQQAFEQQRTVRVSELAEIARRVVGEIRSPIVQSLSQEDKFGLLTDADREAIIAQSRQAVKRVADEAPQQRNMPRAQNGQFAHQNVVSSFTPSSIQRLLNGR